MLFGNIPKTAIYKNCYQNLLLPADLSSVFDGAARSVCDVNSLQRIFLSSPPIAVGTVATTTTPVLERPLICVVGQYADVKETFPPDGLCDYIFYAEVLRLDNQIKATFNIRSFNNFIEISKQYKDTSFGISFHPKYVSYNPLMTDIIQKLPLGCPHVR